MPSKEDKASRFPWKVTAESDGTLRVRYMHAAYPAGTRLREEHATLAQYRLNSHDATLADRDAHKARAEAAEAEVARLRDALGRIAGMDRKSERRMPAEACHDLARAALAKGGAA